MIYTLDSTQNYSNLQRVKIGDIIKLTLQENPATGYQWHLDQFSNLRGLKKVSDKFISDGEPDVMVGCGGKREIEYEVQSVGLFSIILHYYRLWEGEGGKLATYKTLGYSV